MILPITRPLIALDVETNDKVEPEKARIVELGFKIIYPTVIEREPLRWVSYIRPDLLISAGATEVHGITNDVVMGCQTCYEQNETVQDAETHALRVFEDGQIHEYTPWPTFKSLAVNLAKGFTNVDFAGYHVRFDLRVIGAEMERAGVTWAQGDARLLDSMHLWRVCQPRTLSDAVRTFLKREPTEAHRALGDAEDALDVALAQIEMYPEVLPPDLQKLFELCFDNANVDPDGKIKWVDGHATIAFGKWKNTNLRFVPRDYFQWILDKGDFSADVKRIARDALHGVYPTKVSPTEDPF